MNCPNCGDIVVSVNDLRYCSNCDWKIKSTHFLFSLDKQHSDDARQCEWECYEILHAGEGPCVNPETVIAAYDLTSVEAAEEYAYGLMLSEDDLEDGMMFNVAVKTRDGKALFYSVELLIE